MYTSMDISIYIYISMDINIYIYICIQIGVSMTDLCPIARPEVVVVFAVLDSFANIFVADIVR